MFEMDKYQINSQEIKGILNEILNVLERPGNISIMNDIAVNSNNDAIVQAQNAIPFIARIQMDVISRHGFTPDSRGLVNFTHLVLACKGQDPDIAMMSDKIKSYGIPPLQELR